MHRVIVVGSPRVEGRSAHLADELFNACIEECPDDGVSIVSVASIDVAPCTGCNACAHACAEPASMPDEGDPLYPHPAVCASDASAHRCVIEDDMAEVRKHLDAADELVVVSPVYFAGAPAQLVCLLDRLQPYYWSNVRAGEKRPCVLHVVGEGGDPHGFEPLIGCVRSALACAGFELELVLNWVGKIDESGEITDEAECYPLPPVGGFAALGLDDFEVVEASEIDEAGGLVDRDDACDAGDVRKADDGGARKVADDDVRAQGARTGRVGGKANATRVGAAPAEVSSGHGGAHTSRKKLSLADAGHKDTRAANGGSNAARSRGNSGAGSGGKRAHGGSSGSGGKRSSGGNAAGGKHAGGGSASSGGKRASTAGAKRGGKGGKRRG